MHPTLAAKPVSTGRRLATSTLNGGPRRPPATTVAGAREVSFRERDALNASLAEDEDDDDSDWGEDEWPVERPLPLPEWGCERPELTFVSLHNYQRFHFRVTQHLHQALAAHCYDTFSNFISFSKEYVASREEYPEMREFYRDYDPPLLHGRYSCVGLVGDLATRLSVLEATYPGIKDATYQVSCEEEVGNADWYCSFAEPPPTRCVKEHVILCVRIRVSGRAGVMLFHPGYHVGEPITVMEDGLAPQTAVVTASTAKAEVHRTFQYRFPTGNKAFVEWKVGEERNGRPGKAFTSLIHVSRPFLSSVHVTERRNLSYPFKTLLGRDGEGRLKCGLYFPVRDCHRTSINLFHEVDGVLRHLKRPMSYFEEEEEEEEEDEVEEAIAAIAAGTGRSRCELRANLVTLAHLLQDEDLVKQLLELNTAIEEIRA